MSKQYDINSRWISYHSGLIAECIARCFLRLKLYSVIEKRLKTKYGEIDIIACKNKTIVFVEVKTRATVEAGLYSITPNAKKRIIAAAGIYMARHPKYALYQWRYDIIIVTSLICCTHLIDAFRPTT